MHYFTWTLELVSNTLWVIVDNADVTSDKPSNATFSNWIKSAQENAALAITGTIKGTSKEKLYQELETMIWNNEEEGVVSKTLLFL